MRSRTASGREPCAFATAAQGPASRPDDASGVRERRGIDDEAFDLVRPHPPARPEAGALRSEARGRPFDPEALPWSTPMAHAASSGGAPAVTNVWPEPHGSPVADAPLATPGQSTWANDRDESGEHLAAGAGWWAEDTGLWAAEADEDEAAVDPASRSEEDRASRPLVVGAGWLLVAASLALFAWVASHADARNELMRWGTLGHLRPMDQAIHTLLRWIAVR